MNFPGLILDCALKNLMMVDSVSSGIVHQIPACENRRFSSLIAAGGHFARRNLLLTESPPAAKREEKQLFSQANQIHPMTQCDIFEMLYYTSSDVLKEDDADHGGQAWLIESQ